MAFKRDMKLTDIQRRAKARCIRALVQMEPADTVDQAAKKHHMSRATAYRVIEELEAWECTATPQDEAREILAQTKLTEYHPNLWLLVSGKLALAYMQGHDGIGPELFGDSPDLQSDLSDPLLS
jgi:hypothetical protein